MSSTIKMLREQKGYSQTYLASVLHVSRQMYIRYENGEVEPPVSVVRNLCRFYDVSYDTVIDDRLNPGERIEDGDLYVCESSVSSLGTAKKNETIRLLETLNYDETVAVLAFIKVMNENHSAIRPPVNPVKEDFLKYGGKLKLDPDEVIKNREESMV